MLIDSHCHLIDPKHVKSPKALMRGARDNGIKRVITTGTNLSDSKKNIELAETLEGVYATIGIYPHEQQDLSIEEIREGLEKLLPSKKVVGIGECGIDTVGRGGERSIQKQVELFEMQIKLAIKHDLPIVIHNRNGDEQLLKILKKYKGSGLTGVIHCFTSTWEVAEEALAAGFYLGFTGIITYPSGKNLWEVIRKTPTDKILVETDAPYLSPQSVRKEINEPKYVRITAKTLAGVKKMSFEDLSQTLYQNTCRLFSKIN